jgi:hypothetical protein
MYIATENAFPDSNAKAAFSWKRLEEAISSNDDLKTLKDQALKVEKNKEMLIDYVRSLSLSLTHFSYSLTYFSVVERRLFHERHTGK